MELKRGFFVGLLIGGCLVEWAVSSLYWRRQQRNALALGRGSQAEIKQFGPYLQQDQRQQQRLVTAEKEVSRLQAELAENRQKLASTSHELELVQKRLAEAEQTIEQLRRPLSRSAEPAND